MYATNDTITKVNRSIPKNYKENYTGKEYNYTEQDPTFLEKFKLWLSEMLYNLLKDYKINNNSIYYLKMSFYFFVIIVAVYVIAKMFFYKEGNWFFRKKQENNNLTYQNEVEIIETANFELLIKKATQQEDYRLAVKYGYFWILQKLSEKEIIELSNLKTNADYQLEIHNTNYSQQFKIVSYYYNYIWYGKFAIDKIAYQKVENIYSELLNNLNT